MMRRSSTIGLYTLLLALVLCGVGMMQVTAHAKVKEAFPAQGATIGAAPAQVLLTFSEETSPTKSGGSVTDANGATVSTGFRVALANRTRMAIDLPLMLPTGTYTVKWSSFTEDDGGAEQGTYTFTVRDGAPIPTPPAAAAPTITAPVAPAETGIPVAVWMLLAVVVAGIGVFAVRFTSLRRKGGD